MGLHPCTDLAPPPLVLQQYATGPAFTRAVGTAEVVDAFKASPQGRARAAEMEECGSYTELDMARLVTKRCVPGARPRALGRCVDGYIYDICVYICI